MHLLQHQLSLHFNVFFWSAFALFICFSSLLLLYASVWIGTPQYILSSRGNKTKGLDSIIFSELSVIKGLMLKRFYIV